MASQFGILIKKWRKKRRMSQLDLALDAEISTRHLSFLETGRSKPSQEMVLILASALEVPLRERNTLMQAAGFQAVYRESLEDSEGMEQVNRALDFLLNQAEPYAAVVMDRQYNVLRYNHPMTIFMELFLGEDQVLEEFNIMDATFDPDVFRPYIMNFEEVAPAFLDRLHRQYTAEADPRTKDLIDKISAYPGVPKDWRTLQLERPTQLLIPLKLEKGPLRLSLFTTLTILGTAQDITTSDLAIEHYFPADDATDALVRSVKGQKGLKA